MQFFRAFNQVYKTMGRFKTDRPNMNLLAPKADKFHVFYDIAHAYLVYTLACYVTNMVGELIN